MSASRLSSRWLALLLLVPALAGCRGAGERADRPEAPARPPPPLAAIVESYNARAGLLSQVWSRLTLRVEATDEDGSKRVENTEGYLQFVQPSRVSLMVNKLGETYLVLGCDEERYWWMSLTDERTALVGRHDRATPERAAEFGIPMHPLDMLDLMAVRPVEAGSASASWDGPLVRLTLPARSDSWGPRQVWLEGDAYTPVRARVLDAAGATVAESELRDHGPITVRQGATPPRLARTVLIIVPPRQARVRMQLMDADNRTPRPEVFDLWELIKRHRIGAERVLDLDRRRGSSEEAGPEARSGPALDTGA